MGIEDEGLEPEFEEEPKKSKKAEKVTAVKTKKVKNVSKNSIETLSEGLPSESIDVSAHVACDTVKVKKDKKKKKAGKSEATCVEEKETAQTDEVPEKKMKKKSKRKAPAKSNGAEPTEKEEEKESEKKRKSEGTPTDSNGPGPAKRSKKKQASHTKAEDKFADLLERIKDINVAFKVREILSTEVAAGKLEAIDVANVFSQWRRLRKYMASEARVAKVVEMDGTYEEVRSVANELVNKRLLFAHQVGEILYKWKNRERRRVNRQEQKLANKFCFHCRKAGHMLSDCPDKESEDSASFASGICFKCGSGEHSIGTCPRKHVKGFPFATCFVCNEQGHLSRDCEKNINGIYPDGGCCNVCGSQKHLKRDCPELAAQKKEETEKKVVAQTMTSMTRPDDDYDALSTTQSENKEKKKKVKVVKF